MAKGINEYAIDSGKCVSPPANLSTAKKVETRNIKHDEILEMPKGLGLGPVLNFIQKFGTHFLLLLLRHVL